MKHIEDVNGNRYNCSGCTACMSVCPKRCITMMPDAEGFLYPKVDITSCSDCGLCAKVCPWLKEGIKSIPAYPLVYAAKNRDNDVRMNSTSGGVFTALADFVIDNGGCVYGASFVPESQSVEHICVTDEAELSLLRGSKYVQSSLGNTFQKVRTDLNNGKMVLFTGTPCQCSGLRSFLRKPYENLYIVDILCHSAPSPKLLSDTLKYYGGNIERISFRSKAKGWRNSYQFELTDKNNSIHIDSSYLVLFFKSLVHRPSCHNCRYTRISRDSDMTIGDYWNINNVVPSFEDAMGVSCVFVNNDHGNDMFKRIEDSLQYVETSLAPAIQGCMKSINPEPSKRRQFWKDYEEHGYEYCMNRYGHYTTWEKLKGCRLANIIKKVLK